MPTLISTLEETARLHAGKTAIVLGPRRVSYAELDEESNKVANALAKLGIGKGDRVAMLLSNSPEFVSTYFGIAKVGAIAVPLDTRYKIEELTGILNSCEPKIIVSESAFLGPIIPEQQRFSYIEHLIEVGNAYDGQCLSYQELMDMSQSTRMDVEITPDDLGTISYTSGPTSEPHGAVFTHGNLYLSAINSADVFQQNDKDVVMSFALPMYHMFGLAVVLLSSISKGSTIIIVPGTGISINTLMEAIERERGTMLLGVPYIYALAVKLANQEGIKSDLSSLRFCCSGGAPLTVDLIRQFRKCYGLTIIDIWGLTEAVAQVTCQPIDGKGKLGASGKALPGWQMKIVDDNDNELPVNQQGEIIIKGPMMREYYNNPQATAEKINNGWLHTGDIGRVDKDGYMFITGRKKNMIILKGQNIYPIDIEKVLRAFPKIAEAKIIGIPDKLRGEIVGAIIRLKRRAEATEQEIRRFCTERMADYKLPKQITFTRIVLKNFVNRIGTENLAEYLAKLYPPKPQRKKAKS